MAIATHPVRKYKAVGRCIYCGAYSSNLTLEHIIPRGLAGNALKLPNSSCTSCQSITARFEQTCLRTMMGPFRIRVGAPTRHPKDRPDHLPLMLSSQNEDQSIRPSETILVPAEQFPLNFIALRMSEAGALRSRSLAESNAVIDWELWTRYDPKEVQRYTAGAGTGVRLGQINPLMFARLLAKIAHGYAVAERGYGSFSPLVTGLILGKVEPINHWVGGDWEIPDPSPPAFELSIEEKQAGDKLFLVVNVRMFSFFGTPQYHVVVGQL